MGEPTLRVLSLGGGTQSTVMLMAGSQGLFGPPPDLAVFADTGAEPPEVYEMIEWLTENSPIEVVTAIPDGVPLEDAARTLSDIRGKTAGAVIPTRTVKRENGDEGFSPRFCTPNWKVKPIEREIRRHLGVRAVTKRSGIRVEQWIGFSTDEIGRCKPNSTPWITNRSR